MNFLGVSGNQSHFEYIPPGKRSMAIATPISLALSWPLTDRHRTWGVASHLLSLQCTVDEFDLISPSPGFCFPELPIGKNPLEKKHSQVQVHVT